MKKHYIIARTLALLMLFVGTFACINFANKIICTATNMAILNDNIQFYNDQYRKTDEMTEEVKYYITERETKYYNSDDQTVYWFANLPTLFKVIIAALACTTYPICIYMWTMLIIMSARKIKRMNDKQKRKMN